MKPNLMTNKKVLKSLSISLIALGCHFTAFADEPRIYGFASQGLIDSLNSPYVTKGSENGTLKLNELGLNLNWIYNPKWRFSGQLLSQTFGDVRKGTPKVDYLLADYLAFDNGLNSAGIRLGRVKTPYGLYNDSRDFPSSRPGVLLPDSIYYEGIRDFMVSTDGVNLYSNHFLPSGNLQVDAYFGTKETSDDAVERYLFRRTFDNGEITNIEKYGLNFIFEPTRFPDLKFNYSYMQLQPKAKLDENFGVDSGTGIKDIKYHSYLHLLSMQYSHQEHTFTAEYSDILNKGSVTSIYDTKENLSTRGYGYYLQWEWLPLPNLETWLRYSRFINNRKKRDEDDLPAYSNVTTVAGRWYFTPNLNLTVQYDLRQGNANIPIYADYEESEMKKYWSVLIGQLNYQYEF